MLPNLSVLWVIFFILVLTFVVDRLLLKPVLGVIRRREEAIESARELARRSATEAQAATAEFERKTTAARAEMYREMDEMRRAALGHRAEIVDADARGGGGAGGRGHHAPGRGSRRRRAASSRPTRRPSAPPPRRTILGRKAI